MSGGDLDGDVYMVIWDRSLVSNLDPKNIKPPAVYKKFHEESECTSDNILDHMKRYFEKDNLGHISHLHLALCSQIGIDGPMNSDAIELSWYMSIAVDFAKHGKCVDEKLYSKIQAKID